MSEKHKSKPVLDDPDQVTRYGDTINIELWYPPYDDGDETGNAKYIEVDLCSVRAADSIRISYDFERDGYKIEQRPHIDHDDWVEETGDWQEVAFIKAWALMKPEKAP